MEIFINILSQTISLLNQNGNSFELDSVEVGLCKNELDSLYHVFNFENWIEIGYSVSFFVYPLKQLKQMQNGWYYIGNDRHPDNEHWKPNWIVFGGINEDAIFYDTETNHVYGCIDKKLFFLLGHSLTEFFEIINFCMSIEYSKYGIGNVYTDDEEYSKEFLEDIGNFLNQKGQKLTKEFVSFFFG